MKLVRINQEGKKWAVFTTRNGTQWSNVFYDDSYDEGIVILKAFVSISYKLIDEKGLINMKHIKNAIQEQLSDSIDEDILEQIQHLKNVSASKSTNNSEYVLHSDSYDIKIKAKIEFIRKDGVK